MEKKAPFFLTRLLRRNPQNSEFGEQKGWGITADDTRFGGWGSSPGSTSSGSIANGWADELPDNHYNGWAYEKPKNEYNGWGSIPDGESATPEASRNSCMKVELPESVPTSNQSRLLNADSFPCPPVPSAPPLPYVGSKEHHATNASDHSCLDFKKNDVVSMNQIKKGNASCVVCWEAPVEGACVPCRHMSSCMPCLREIESKQGICPVCRAKIDKVLRIYAIST